MVLWSLSNEILWLHSVESSSCFRLIEQVSYQLVVALCSPIFVVLRVCSYDFCYIWYDVLNLSFDEDCCASEFIVPVFMFVSPSMR
jgi:hypothetical protein